MAGILEAMIPEDQREEIKELVSILVVLPKEDRAVLLSNAHVLKVRSDIEKSKNKEPDKAAG